MYLGVHICLPCGCSRRLVGGAPLIGDGEPHCLNNWKYRTQWFNPGILLVRSPRAWFWIIASDKFFQPVILLCGWCIWSIWPASGMLGLELMGWALRVGDASCPPCSSLVHYDTDHLIPCTVAQDLKLTMGPETIMEWICFCFPWSEIALRCQKSVPPQRPKCCDSEPGSSPNIQEPEYTGKLQRRAIFLPCSYVSVILFDIFRARPGRRIPHIFLGSYYFVCFFVFLGLRVWGLYNTRTAESQPKSLKTRYSNHMQFLSVWTGRTAAPQNTSKRIAVVYLLLTLPENKCPREAAVVQHFWGRWGRCQSKQQLPFDLSTVKNLQDFLWTDAKQYQIDRPGGQEGLSKPVLPSFPPATTASPHIRDTWGLPDNPLILICGVSHYCDREWNLQPQPQNSLLRTSVWGAAKEGWVRAVMVALHENNSGTQNQMDGRWMLWWGPIGILTLYGRAIWTPSACYKGQKPQLPKVVMRARKRCFGMCGSKACCTRAKEGCKGTRGSWETVCPAGENNVTPCAASPILNPTTHWLANAHPS